MVVVGVGATTDADAVASFSNVASFLSLLAPGVVHPAGVADLPDEPLGDDRLQRRREEIGLDAQVQAIEEAT